MDNKDKYKNAFVEAFSIDENKLKKNLEYNTIPLKLFQLMKTN